MKCPNCGCEDFLQADLKTDNLACDGGALPIMVFGTNPVIAYVCKKCGRIELYDATIKFKENYSK